MKKIITIIICLTFSFFEFSCSKATEDQLNNTEENAKLSGTNWKCCVWSADGFTVHAELNFYNSNVKVTTYYRSYEKTQSSGTYSIQGNKVTFSNLSVTSANGQYFSFKSAELSHSILFVDGICNYQPKSWEFREGTVH